MFYSYSLYITRLLSSQRQKKLFFKGRNSSTGGRSRARMQLFRCRDFCSEDCPGAQDLLSRNPVSLRQAGAGSPFWGGGPLSPRTLQWASQRAARPLPPIPSQEEENGPYNHSEPARVSRSGSTPARACRHTKPLSHLLTLAACELHLNRKEKRANKGIEVASIGKPQVSAFAWTLSQS